MTAVAGKRGGMTSCWSYASQYDQLKEPEALVSVRQVPPNRRSVTGLLPSRKNAKVVSLDTALERDLATILEFDDAVATYEAPPIAHFYDCGGKDRFVTGFLVLYHPPSGRSPLLCDVLYRGELFARWPRLKPRIRAAKRRAIENGWDYRLLTEVEIRTPYLDNARFLLPYARCAPDPIHERQLFDMLKTLRMATPALLLSACYFDEWKRAELIPTLWCMVGRGRIAADLDVPLTMVSTLWLER